jgi:predicted nucleotidyltransferase
MDKDEALTLVKQYADKVVKELSPEQIILYGSYSTNSAHKDSDIDIAVIFNGFKGDFWKTSSLLWKLTRPIDAKIEPILLDRSNDKSGFVEHIIKTGEVIYPN